MNRFTAHPRHALLCLVMFSDIAVSHAQSVAADASSSLAKHDKNQNGRLDPEELAAKQAEEAKARTSVDTVRAEPEGKDGTVLLSPFEVTSDAARGYYASSTMSGTRINSRIEDLASSITVITKEQMADFAMLDINDIFQNEVSTEGLHNYTEFEVTTQGELVDNAMRAPNTANRVRGIAGANISLGNYETSRRVPIDPLNIDSVEISRGPNSSIFGLGNAGGTVNMVASSSSLSRNRTQVQFRADNWDGYRTSFDVNRVLKKNVLAVRGSAVFQHDEWVRKPSGANTTRLNGMIKFQPFKATSLSASYSHYKLNGNRPNYTMPRDGISLWRSAGSPSWDPVTGSYRLNGVLIPFTGVGRVVPPFFSNQNFHIAASGAATSLVGVDRDGTILHWTPSVPSTNPTPQQQDQTRFRYVETNNDDRRAAQPLFGTFMTMQDKTYYDWEEINLAAMNRSHYETGTYKVELDHFFLNTPRHLLAVQLGWFREDSKHRERAIYGTPNGLSSVGGIRVDVNERYIDGRPNPNFMRPYFGTNWPITYDSPLLNDTYRAQLAYQLDLRKETNVLRWLGLHRMVGYKEYKDHVTRRFAFQDAILSDHAWLPPGTSREQQNTVIKGYYQYYVGDANGQNVDYAPAPGDFRYGTTTMTWGNALTNNWRNEQINVGLAATTRSTAGGNNIRRVLKTEGGTLQSHFLDGRIVTTFGLRNDRVYSKRGVTARLMPDGISHDVAWDKQWEAGDWLFREGRTKTAGIVVKPTRWLSLHAGKSNSFLPATPAKDLYLTELPDPFNRGHDYGISLNLFDGKLILRATQYKTEQLGTRTSSVIATVRRLDIWDGTTSRPFGLNLRARNWLRNANPGFTEAQLDQAVADTMKMPLEQLKGLEDTTLQLADWNDVTSKGTEIEIAYNPTNYWTVKLNLAKQQTINTALSDSVARWVDERMPVWQSIIDRDTGQPWFTMGYPAGAPTAQSYLAGNFTSQFKVLRALLGKSLPQVRKYRANFSTNFRLSGITDQRILKRFNVGGALRWQDKGAIGYYGVQQLPNVILDLDPNRPIWDKAQLQADVFLAYRTKLHSDKISATFQLNVRNLQESGRLQTISAFPDGSPNGLRIVDPRQFILTVTFDL